MPYENLSSRMRQNLALLSFTAINFALVNSPFVSFDTMNSLQAQQYFYRMRCGLPGSSHFSGSPACIMAAWPLY